MSLAHLVGGPRDGETVEVPDGPGPILVALPLDPRASHSDEPIEILRYQPTDELRRFGILGEKRARVYTFEGHQ